MKLISLIVIPALIWFSLARVSDVSKANLSIAICLITIAAILMFISGFCSKHPRE